MLAGYTAYNANALSYLSDDSTAYNNCTNGKADHKAGDRYYEYSNVNDAPAADKLELDKNNKPYNFNKIDPKLSSY